MDLGEGTNAELWIPVSFSLAFADRVLLRFSVHNCPGDDEERIWFPALDQHDRHLDLTRHTLCKCTIIHIVR